MADQVLSEALTNTMGKLSKQGKLARLSGGMALQMCKKDNPSLYDRYSKAKSLHMKLKEMIQKKYGMRSSQAAKKATRK